MHSKSEEKMKRNTTSRILSLLLALTMVLSMLAFVGCSDKQTTEPEKTAEQTTAENKTAEQNDEQKITINVKVTHADGSTKDFSIATAADNLMDALDGEKLISQENGMIMSVDGEAADYNANGSWWCITKSGTMLMTGAADTEIADGESYELTYTIG